MYCKKCGENLPDGSIFCNKCGSKIEENLNKEIDSEDNRPEIPVNEKNEQKDFENKKIKISKFLVISFVIVAAIFFVIGYNAYFNSKFSQAKLLYSEGKYYDAEKKLNGLINFSGDKQVNEIKLSGNYGSYLQFYEDEKNLDYVDYNMVLENLFSGLTHCKDNEKNIKNDEEKKIMNNFKDKYYAELNSSFNISKEDVDRILTLDYDTRKNKISEISNDVKSQNNKLTNDRKNPIEFKNLDWDSNSSYTIATGQVYNKSDITIKFVTIKVAFKDKSGNVIDTDSTYAVGSEGLAPGESTKWRASVNKDSNIASYSVSLIDFQN